MLPQHRSGGQGLHRRDVPGARHHKVGFAVLIAAGPLPYPGAFGAVLNRSVPVEILKVRLLVGDDHIDVVAAPQAVIGNR